MRKLLLALLLTLAALPAAARGKLDGWVERGGQQVTINNGLRSTDRFQRSYPSSTVTVYLTGTSTLATLYSDTTGTAKANPFTADSSGYWSFYVDVCVDVRFSGGTAYTLSDKCPPGASTVLGFDAYGATGDGTTDDTTFMQAALDAAATSGAEVTCTSGKTYLFSTLRVRNGVRALNLRNCTLKPDSSTALVTTGALQLEGTEEFGGASVVSRLYVSVNMDMSNGGRTAIYADGTRDSTFEYCNIYGFTNHATLNHYGIILTNGTLRNTIQHNTITGYDNPTARGLLIDLIGASADYASYYSASGVVTLATLPESHNVIFKNQLINGSYGVSMLASERNVISTNVMTGQNHRSIYIANSSNHNEIVNNELMEFISSGVLLTYGSSYNLVAGNIFTKTTQAGSGEAAVNIQAGASHNLIEGNLIHAATNYGIYLGAEMKYNTVKNNKVSYYYFCGIALENDWEDTPPAAALYSRPNYDAPPAPYTDYAWNASVGNVIEGNTVLPGYPGRTVGGIYISQLAVNNDTAHTGTVLRNNHVTGNGASTARYLTVYEETAGKLSGGVYQGNTFSEVAGTAPSSAKVVLSNGANHFVFHSNTQFPLPIISLPVADTSPDVSIGGSAFALVNTAPVTITTFDGVPDGTEILLRLDAFSTLDHDNAVMRLKGSVDIAPSSSNNWVRLRRQSSIWFEIYRSF